MIDSIRHPAEVEALRRVPGRSFVLVAVTAPLEVRYERLKARGRIGDVKDFEEFRHVEQMELSSNDPNGQHVSDVIQQADYIIDNSSDVQDFMAKIKQFDQSITDGLISAR